MWDHGLEGISNSASQMDKIDAKFVEKEWKNAAFVKFCFFNAQHVSYTPKEGVNKIKADKSGFWKLLHPSDIVTPVSDIPEGYISFGLKFTQFSTFGDRVLVSLTSTSLDSRWVA